MAETTRSRFRFTVKEHADGAPWLMLEPLNPRLLPESGDGFFGFDLKPGVSQEQARKLAALLYESVESMTFTKL
jgi:hypothetical protein